MRLREPLNGFVFAKGHAVIHAVLLFGSVITLNNKTNHYFTDGSKGHLHAEQNDLI